MAPLSLSREFLGCISARGPWSSIGRRLFPACLDPSDASTLHRARVCTRFIHGEGNRRISARVASVVLLRGDSGEEGEACML